MLVRQSGARHVLAGGRLALRPCQAPTAVPAAVTFVRRAGSLSTRRPAVVKSDLVPEVTPKTRAKGSASSTSDFVERYIPNLAKLYQAVGKRSTETAVARPAGPTTQAENFRRSLKGGRVAKLSGIYRELMAKVQPGGEMPIKVEELRAAIQLVGRAGSDDHWTLLDTMVRDLETLIGSPPTLEDYRAVLYFLANSSTPRAAFPRLETIPLGVPITTTDFNIVLAGLSRAGDLEALRTCMEQLPLLDLQPNEQTMLLFLRGLFAGHAAALPDVDLAALRAEVSKALDNMRPRGLPESPEIWAVLAEGYLQVGDLETSRKATDALRVALRHARYESLSPVAWTSLVRCTSIGESSAKALREVLAMKEAGVTPDASTIQALIQTAEVGTVDQVRQLLQQVESVTGVRSTASHWAVLIDRVVHREGGVVTRAGLDEALQVYRESRNLAVDPSADMILPIIATLCNPGYQASDEARESDLNTALGLYDDLLAAEQERYLDIVAEPVLAVPCATDVGALLEPRTPSFGPTVEVYDILLEGISSSRTLRSHDQAWELLGDMKARGLYFETGATVRHIKAFMARAKTHKYAFGCYDRFLKLHPPALGASREAFLAVADAFIHSSYPTQVNPHPRLVFEFINDMRRAGYDEGHAVMTTLFSQLANLSYTGAEMSTREENENIMKRMAWCTRLAAAWCRTDPFIQMDKHLLNAMMNALTRVGNFKDAYEVWQMLSEAENYDQAANNASVNIILDAIGLHGNPFMAEQLWKWLRDGSFPLTLSNWHALVQACLRLGALELLVKFITVDMRQNLGHPPAPSPTAETLSMVLAYQDAYRHGDLNRIHLRSALESAFPELWPQVKDTPAKDWWQMEMLDVEREMGDAIKPLLIGTEFEDGFDDYEAGSERDGLDEELAAEEEEILLAEKHRAAAASTPSVRRAAAGGS